MGGVRHAARRRKIAGTCDYSTIAAGRMMARPLLFAIALAGASGPSMASETTSYSYDPLGRLTKASNTGGPRDGKETNTAFDPAGNRATHAVALPPPEPVNNAVFSISGPAPVTEGQAAVFTISKTGIASSALTVNFATSNGTAVAPGDYVATSGTLTFSSPETVRTVSVTTLTDSVVEGSEQFSLNLSAPSAGLSLGTATATATVMQANRPPVANFDVASVEVCTSVTVNVIANDTDPEGNYPLTLVSVTTDGPGTTATKVNSTQVRFKAGGIPGGVAVHYVVSDSLGATSIGLLDANVTGGPGCP